MADEDKTKTAIPEPKPYLYRFHMLLLLGSLLVGLGGLLATLYWRMYDDSAKPLGVKIETDVDHGLFFLPPRTNTNKSLSDTDSRLSKIKTLTVLTMTNAGDRVAAGVRVQVGCNGIAHVEWDDGHTQQLDFAHEISIGSIPVAKTVYVAMWAEKDFRTVLVAHDSGTTLVPMKPKTDSSVWIHRTYTMAGLLLVYMVSSIVVVHLNRKRNEREIIDFVDYLDKHYSDRIDKISGQFEDFITLLLPFLEKHGIAFDSIKAEVLDRLPDHSKASPEKLT